MLSFILLTILFCTELYMSYITNTEPNFNCIMTIILIWIAGEISCMSKDIRNEILDLRKIVEQYLVNQSKENSQTK